MKKFIHTLFVLCIFGLMSQTSFAAGKNLVAGIGPLISVTSWANFSTFSVISGPTLFSTASKTTVLYVAFTAGTQADLGNLVIYKTATRSPKITAIIPVTYKGVSNPSIHLSDKAVCKVQPVSTAHPCIVRLDPLTLTLSAASDYYFEAYFSPSSNNGAIGLGSAAFLNSALTGGFSAGDSTQLTVGQSVPNNNSGRTYFHVAVQSN